MIKGRIDHKQQGETKLIALEVSAFEAVQERPRSASARRPFRSGGLIKDLAHLVKDYPGPSMVFVSLETSLGPKTLALGPDYRVAIDTDFLTEARTLLAPTRFSKSSQRALGLLTRPSDTRDVWRVPRPASPSRTGRSRVRLGDRCLARAPWRHHRQRRRVLPRSCDFYPALEELGVHLLRVHLNWGGRLGVATRRPREAPTPTTRPRLASPDRIVLQAERYGVEIVHGLRHAVLGERRRRPDARRATRRGCVSSRTRPQRDTAAPTSAPTGSCFPASATGRPGTSRTSRSA